MSYREGLRLLAEKDEPETQPAEEPAAAAPGTEYQSQFNREPGWMGDRCKYDVDALHTFALVADARGWTAVAIAEYLPADLVEVEAFLCPRPPLRSVADFDALERAAGRHVFPVDNHEVARAYADTVA